ncbi:hypothetical protein OU800_10975 [Pseudomonas sp. GOM7]|uniref:hypothetical protein n=1 Tax=Pseudomonas sp. GOM7 TaxID=2998079 RepID=UPI00227C4EB0|nr:hypothetical protein [Pseudomonas sp. GOM7]WAJ39715.1 hypothetical protein OU800_10975 [Pseudomonas sp. GOM7]
MNDAHGNLLELNQYRPAAFRCNTWGAACGPENAAPPPLLQSSQAVASNKSVSGAISHLLDITRSLIDLLAPLAGEMADACVRAETGAMTREISDGLIAALVDYWQILA